MSTKLEQHEPASGTSPELSSNGASILYRRPKPAAATLPVRQRHKDEHGPKLLDPKFIPTPLGDQTYHRSVKSTQHLRKLRGRMWQVLKELLGIAARVVWLRLRGMATGDRVGQMVAESCERQGVLWVKVGQLLAMRNDIFSQEFCTAMSRLHDKAIGFPPDDALRELEREIQSPIGHYFLEFNPVPIAAASISQVHLGRLKHCGSLVAIKIQRPDAAPTFRADIRVFKQLVKLLAWLKFMPLMRWDDLAWEVDHVMREELDFRVEATSMRRMRKNLRPQKIYVPRLFEQFTTERLLVMEFVHGVLMSDVLRVQREDPERVAAWMQANNIKPNKVGSRLLLSYLQQLFEDRLFHADMHPGNLILLRNSRISLIDFGSIGFLERDLLRKYDGYLEALGRGNHAKAIDLLLTATNSLPPGNLAPLKDTLLRVTKDWEARCRVDGLTYDETSASSLLDQTVRHGMAFGIDQNWTFLKVIRSWATMDVSLRTLLSDTDLKSMLARYYTQRGIRQRMQLLQTKAIGPGEVQRGLEFGDTALENFLLRGSIMRRMGQVFEGATNKINQFFAVGFGLAALGCVGLAMALVVLIIHQRFAVLPDVLTSGRIGQLIQLIPQLDFQVWGLGLIVSIYLASTFVSLRFRFTQAEDNSSFL